MPPPSRPIALVGARCVRPPLAEALKRSCGSPVWRKQCLRSTHTPTPGCGGQLRVGRAAGCVLLSTRRTAFGQCSSPRAAGALNDHPRRQPIQCVLAKRDKSPWSIRHGDLDARHGALWQPLSADIIPSKHTPVPNGECSAVLGRPHFWVLGQRVGSLTRQWRAWPLQQGPTRPKAAERE